MNAMRLKILRSCAAGPCWKRTFHAAKSVYDAMISEGLLEGCKPPGGRANNMLRITAKGRVVLAGDDA